MSAMKIRAQAIKELEDKEGHVTAELLVKAAADRRHPMHGDFPWDDKIAGHRHRLDIARRIITSVRVSITIERRKISSVAYVRDPEMLSGRQGYISVSKLRSERDSAQEALLAEIVRIQSMLERAKELAAVLDLESELDAMLDAAMQLSARIRKGPSIAQELVA